MTCKDTGVYISIRKLPALGKSTAESTKLHGTVRGASIAEGIGADLRRIKAAAAECSELYGSSTDVPKAAEWLLDNWYVADREGLAAASDLRASGRLPRDGSRGCAAIEVAAAVLVSGGRGEVTEERISLFLNGYQDGRILTERELAAFIPVLKAALISFLKSACDNGLDNDDAPAVMENIFTSLRFLESFSSPELMESVNRVDAVLRTDPAGVYSRMDEKTRSVYRACVSRLARRHGTDEYSAAKRAIERAGEHDRHVGHYLF
jgi:cyclic beta-1,2-glucan synthetase